MQQTNFVAQPKRSRADGFLHQILIYCISSFAHFVVFFLLFFPLLLHLFCISSRLTEDCRCSKFVRLLPLMKYAFLIAIEFRCHTLRRRWCWWVAHQFSGYILPTHEFGGQSIGHRCRRSLHTEPHGTIVCGYLSKWFAFFFVRRACWTLLCTPFRR